MGTLSPAVGHEVAYLTNAVASGREGYYQDAVTAGEPAGLWHGRGAETLGLSGEVDAKLLEGIYQHRLDPRDPRSRDEAQWGEAATLGVPFAPRSPDKAYAKLLAAEPDAGPERRVELRAQAERETRQSAEFYDLTFSPEKSVSILGVAYERAAADARAAGRWDEAASWDEKARTLEQCVLDAGRAGLDYIEAEAAYGKRGHFPGGRWIDTNGITAAQFLQHDSRNHDPQLHVHQPIFSYVEGADGKWTKIDGTPLFAEARNGASAVASRHLYADMTEKLGVSWRARPDGNGFEIVGVPTSAADLMSSRRRETTGELDRLRSDWVAKYGREPNAPQMAKLSQQATLNTRQAKTHDGETREQMLERWERETREGVHASLAQIAYDVTAAADANPPPREDFQFASVVDRAAHALATKRTGFTRSQMMREINAQLPANWGLAAAKTREALSQLADAAMERMRPTREREELPEGLRLRNGESAFQQPGSPRYVADSQLQAEVDRRLAAQQGGGFALSQEDVKALVDRYAEHGRELGGDQAAALTGLLTDGAKISTVVAPAGAGKSYLMGAYSDAMREHGHAVHGLAPSQIAADRLADEGLSAANVDRWLATQARIDGDRMRDGDDRFRITAGDTVVLDEASMASGSHVDAVRELCDAKGAKLVLTGDPRQLGAVNAAGGTLADLSQHASHTYELTEVRRFNEEWERHASLGLRDGDRAALDDYLAHGRLWGHGTPEQTQAGALRHWLADTLGGKDSLLLASSNEAAAELSASARRELALAGQLTTDGPSVLLGRDRNHAGVGDLVQARNNRWDLPDGAAINRAMYRITEVPEGGGLRVAPVLGRGDDGREQLGDVMGLPADYVAEDLALGYASTVDAAEGRDVDTGHPVVGPGWTPESLYVASTRGREANHLHVATRHPAPDYPSGQALEFEPRAARAVLADIVERDSDKNESAHQILERDQVEARSVDAMLTRMLHVASEHTAGRTSTTLDRLAADGALSERDRVQLAADGTGAVDRVLRAAELAGHDRDEVLRDAVSRGDFRDARDAGKTLYSRIENAAGRDFTPRLNSFADLVPQGLPESLRPTVAQWAETADERRRELGAQAAAEPPGWAIKALGELPEDLLERGEWEDKAGWAAAAREMSRHTDDEDILGPPPPSGLAEKYAIWREAHSRLDLPDAGADEREMSTGGLRARVEAWRREEAWAPKYVGDELATTRAEAEKARIDSEVFGGRLATVSEDEKDGLGAAWMAARRTHEELAERVKQLEIADEARQEWALHTMATRDRKERAEAELASRGIDPAEREDRVTAEEWMAERAKHLEAEEPHRDITPADIDDDEDEAADTNDQTEAATGDGRTDAVAVPEERLGEDEQVSEQVQRGGNVRTVPSTTGEIEVVSATLNGHPIDLATGKVDADRSEAAAVDTEEASGEMSGSEPEAEATGTHDGVSERGRDAVTDGSAGLDDGSVPVDRDRSAAVGAADLDGPVGGEVTTPVEADTGADEFGAGRVGHEVRLSAEGDDGDDEGAEQEREREPHQVDGDVHDDSDAAAPAEVERDESRAAEEDDGEDPADDGEKGHEDIIPDRDTEPEPPLEESEADQQAEPDEEPEVVGESHTTSVPDPERAEDDDKPQPEPEDTKDKDGPLLETNVPDIRDTSEADPSEHDGKASRDRVPSTDEAAAAVERAKDAAREMREREAEDSRRAADDDRPRAAESASSSDVAVDV